MFSISSWVTQTFPEDCREKSRVVRVNQHGAVASGHNKLSSGWGRLRISLELEWGDLAASLQLGLVAPAPMGTPGCPCGHGECSKDLWLPLYFGS